MAVAAAALTAVGLGVVNARTGTDALAVLVAMVFGVYAGFALSHGSPRQNMVELGFIVIGLVLTAAGLRLGRPWIAAALGVHGVWDVLHDPTHHVIGTGGVPRWYVRFCAAYDVLAAIAILTIR